MQIVLYGRKELAHKFVDDLLIKQVRACVCLFKEKKIFSDIIGSVQKKKNPKSGVSKSKINQKDTLERSPRNTMLNHLVSLLTRAQVSSARSMPAGNRAVIKKSDRLGTISLAVFRKENSGVQRFKQTDLTTLQRLHGGDMFHNLLSEIVPVVCKNFIY